MKNGKYYIPSHPDLADSLYTGKSAGDFVIEEVRRGRKNCGRIPGSYNTHTYVYDYVAMVRHIIRGNQVRMVPMAKISYAFSKERADRLPAFLFLRNAFYSSPIYMPQINDSENSYEATPKISGVREKDRKNIQPEVAPVNVDIVPSGYDILVKLIVAAKDDPSLRKIAIDLLRAL